MMATLEQQEAIGKLMRKTADASYKLHPALFKFQTTANYFDEIPESAFTAVEQAIGEVEDTLTRIRATMAMSLGGEVHDASGSALR